MDATVFGVLSTKPPEKLGFPMINFYGLLWIMENFGRNLTAWGMLCFSKIDRDNLIATRRFRLLALPIWVAACLVPVLGFLLSGVAGSRRSVRQPPPVTLAPPGVPPGVPPGRGHYNFSSLELLALRPRPEPPQLGRHLGQRPLVSGSPAHSQPVS